MKKIISFLLIIFTTFSAFIFFNSTIVIAQTNIVVENQPIESSVQAQIIGDEVLLPITFIKDYIDPTVYYEKENGKIIFTTEDRVITFSNEISSAMVNAKPVKLNIPVKNIDDVPYVPIQFLSDFLGIKVTYIKENDKVIIDFQKPEIQIGVVLKDKLDIRSKDSFISKMVEKNLSKGTELKVYDIGKKYAQVRTPNGNVGYIDKTHLKIGMSKTKYIVPVPQEPWTAPEGKLNLTWEYVHKTTPEVSTLKTVNGLDVVSPTWFYIGDATGTVINKADKAYSDWAHKNGYEVWGLVTNNFDADMTKVILRDSNLRENVIRQLLIYADLYDLDGINVDFESIYSADRDFLTQFIRELAPRCKEQGLVLSMDVPKPSNYEMYGKSFDYKALNESVDYVMLMAYDQHWGSSPVAGSVAQYTWVEDGIQKILAQGIHKDKLVLGVPFYTRLWKEELIDGKVKVSSKSLSMDAATKIVEEKKLVPVWDAPSAQYYVQYMEDGFTYKIWLEDATSMNMKSSLVHKYDLAGIASWRRGFENQETWQVLNKNLKELDSYEAWKQIN